MTIPATWEPLTETDPVLVIAQDLFSTMIDVEPGHLYPWMGASPSLEDPRYAWVDVAGPVVTRVILMAGRITVEHLTRSLLQMDESEGVSVEDMADAVGEIANVVGGNVKSLVTNPGALTLPVVSDIEPDMSKDFCLLETYFGWKGAPLGVGLWALKSLNEGFGHNEKDGER